mmetsp:Transcript_89160/g.177254  ORF Transcript_89160/g.177254 Transcript_89160/m.177254 type:complete len:86 (+) Transcript_89160:65-322(+)
MLGIPVSPETLAFRSGSIPKLAVDSLGTHAPTSLGFGFGGSVLAMATTPAGSWLLREGLRLQCVSVGDGLPGLGPGSRAVLPGMQ